MTVQIHKYYKGFSTRHYANLGANFAIYNLECVTEDLLNEIFTVKGERVMMPDYGTRIPLLTFELNDTYTQEIIEEDLETVFGHDPRVTLKELTILPDYDKYVMVAIAKLEYHEFNVTQDLRIEIRSK